MSASIHLSGPRAIDQLLFFEGRRLTVSLDALSRSLSEGGALDQHLLSPDKIERIIRSIKGEEPSLIEESEVEASWFNSVYAAWDWVTGRETGVEERDPILDETLVSVFTEFMEKGPERAIDCLRQIKEKYPSHYESVSRPFREFIGSSEEGDVLIVNPQFIFGYVDEEGITLFERLITLTPFKGSCRRNPAFERSFPRALKIVKEQRLKQLFEAIAQLPASEGRTRCLQWFFDQSPSLVVARIETLDLPDEVRVDIASRYIEIDPADLVANIAKFQIADERERFALLRACLPKVATSLAMLIDADTIKDEWLRYELAKACIEAAPCETTLFIEKFQLESEEEQMELARLCCEKAPDEALFKLDDLIKRLSQRNRVILAHLFMEKMPLDFAQMAASFGIEDEVERVGLALECARKRPVDMPYLIAQFDLTSEAHRVEIAKICAELTPHSFPFVFKQFDISPDNQETRIELARICARENPLFVARNIDLFGISREEVLEEFREKLLNTLPVAKYTPFDQVLFFNEDLFDRTNRKLNISLERLGEPLSSEDIITTYSFRTHDTPWSKAINSVEIRREALPGRHPELMQYFLHMADGQVIEAKEDLLKLKTNHPEQFDAIVSVARDVYDSIDAESLLESHPEFLVEIVDELGDSFIECLLKNTPMISPHRRENTPIILANLKKIMTARRAQVLRDVYTLVREDLKESFTRDLSMMQPSLLVTHFDDFSSERFLPKDVRYERSDLMSRVTLNGLPEPVREQFLHQCAVKFPRRVARVFGDFDIRDPEFKCEMMLRCIEQDRKCHMDMKRYYGLSDKERHYEIARYLLENFPTDSGNACNFLRGRERQSIDLAKVLCDRNYYLFKTDVNIFVKTQVPDVRKALLLKIARRETKFFARAKDSFRIESESHRVAAAFSSLRNTSSELAKYFDEIGISHQKVRIEMAKKLLDLNPTLLAENIQKFQIEDESIRLEIAESCARKVASRPAMIRCIKNFAISKESDRLKLALIVASLDPIFFGYLKSFQIHQREHLWSIAKALCSREGVNSDASQDIFFMVLSDTEEMDFLKRDRELLGELYAIRAKALIADFDRFDDVDIRAIEIPEFIQEKIIPSCMKLRHPQLACQNLIYACVLVGVHGAEAAQTAYDELTEVGMHSIPLMVNIARWTLDVNRFSAGESCDVIKAQVKKVVHEGRGAFRNAATGLSDSWIRFMNNLDARITVFSPAQKLAIVRYLVSDIKKEEGERDKQFQERLVLLLNDRFGKVQLLMNLRKYDVLTGDLTEESIDRAILDLISSFGSIRLPEDMENPAGIFLRTVGRTRLPYAFLTYCSIVSHIPELSGPLNRLIADLMRGEFRERRYETEYNPHLALLKETAPESLERWRAKVEPERAIHFAVGGLATGRAHSMRAFFVDKLSHGHFSPEEFPHLVNYIHAESSGEKEAIAARLRGKEEKSREEEVEWLAIQLMGAEVEERRERLQTLIEAIKTLEHPPELKNDLEGLLAQISAKISLSPEFQVVDTDDWEDLLLAGTEVIGSCQRINGDPSLNKCLLDYVMNGRNRMIAIKDSRGRIVARRIFRILLDKETQKPVLFLERTYSNYRNPEIETVLIEYAKKRARELDLPLLSMDGGGAVYPRNIRGLPGPCPWGYCDSALRGEFAGVYEHAEFTISKPHIIDTTS